MTLPNCITLSRIGLIPVFIFIYYLPFSAAHLIAAVIFALACLTDMLDGYLARRMGQSSALGAFLDPVADKLLVTTAIVLLLGHGQLAYLTIASVIIVTREVVISALREWMAELGKRANVAVNLMGKFKTVLQMFALFALLSCSKATPAWWVLLAYATYYLAAALTVWSMFVYFKAAWPLLMADKAE